MRPASSRHQPAPRAEESPTSSPAGPAVGVAPVTWNNADLQGWAPEVPFPAILDEMAAAGFAGTEYGGNFPSEPEPLRAALAARSLVLCGAYRWLPLADVAALAGTRPALDRLLDLLAALGCPNLIVACAMTPERIALAGRVPADGSAGLDAAGWRALGRGLATVSRQAADRGIRVRYHNHAGSYVETPDEVERLLALADQGLFDLCFDTGHYAYGGGDPAAFVARHHNRIGYLHVKDVDAPVLARARAAGVGFFDALRAYVFCELGLGMVPAAGLVRTLLDAGYRGWIVVEQDTCRRPSTESARISRSYLRERCGI